MGDEASWGADTVELGGGGEAPAPGRAPSAAAETKARRQGRRALGRVPRSVVLLVLGVAIGGIVFDGNGSQDEHSKLRVQPRPEVSSAGREAGRRRRLRGLAGDIRGTGRALRGGHGMSRSRRPRSGASRRRQGRRPETKQRRRRAPRCPSTNRKRSRRLCRRQKRHRRGRRRLGLSSGCRASLAVRRTHTPKVAGSNAALAIGKGPGNGALSVRRGVS